MESSKDFFLLMMDDLPALVFAPEGAVSAFVWQYGETRYEACLQASLPRRFQPLHAIGITLWSVSLYAAKNQLDIPEELAWLNKLVAIHTDYPHIPMTEGALL